MSEIDQRARESVKCGFFDRGEQISEWAHKRGFPPALVYSVLSGRSKGRRGKAHAIAVALGLKRTINQSLLDEKSGL